MPKFKVRWVTETYNVGIIEADSIDDVSPEFDRIGNLEDANIYAIVRCRDSYVEESFGVIEEIKDND